MGQSAAVPPRWPPNMTASPRTLNPVTTITTAQKHCCCNGQDVYMKAQNRTQANKCVALNNNLLHHISTKQSAVNNDTGSMRPP